MKEWNIEKNNMETRLVGSDSDMQCVSTGALPVGPSSGTTVDYQQGYPDWFVQALKRAIPAEEKLVLSVRLAPLPTAVELERQAYSNQRRYYSFVAYFCVVFLAIVVGTYFSGTLPWLDLAGVLSLAVAMCFVFVVFQAQVNQRPANTDHALQPLFVITETRIIRAVSFDDHGRQQSICALDRHSIGSLHTSNVSGRFIMTIRPNTHTRNADMQLEFTTKEDIEAVEAILGFRSHESKAAN